MMMFSNFTLAVELISLGVGVALFLWGLQHKGKGVGVAKTFGYIIGIASVVLLACSLYHSIAFGMGKVGVNGPQCAKSYSYYHYNK